MKILVVHASAGAGHQKAAQAIHQGLEKYAHHQSQLVDALDYTSPAFKRLYRQTYSFLITKMPFLWGFFFWLTDQGWLQGGVRLGRRCYNRVNAKHLETFLGQERFDCIIATHFMPIEIVSSLKQSGKIKSQLIAVITDYDVHHIWLGKNVDCYAVAIPWTKEKLEVLGVPAEKIVVTGIPTSEQFIPILDRAQLRERLGLDRDVFTVLIATGSFGIGPIEPIVEKLQGHQIVVICGHNKNLFHRLQSHRYDNVKVMGLVDNMHEWMAVSDCMVTKPGGLSISEALVSQLPLIFFNEIPGQETNNVNVLARQGVGFRSHNIDEICREVERLKSSRDAYLTAIKKMKALARPHAVDDIISLLR